MFFPWNFVQPINHQPYKMLCGVRCSRVMNWVFGYVDAKRFSLDNRQLQMLRWHLGSVQNKYQKMQSTNIQFVSDAASWHSINAPQIYIYLFSNHRALNVVVLDTWQMHNKFRSIRRELKRTPNIYIWWNVLEVCWFFCKHFIAVYKSVVMVSYETNYLCKLAPKWNI